MRAIVVRQHSQSTDVLCFEERQIPEPGHGEIRIRIHAVSLNHLDTWVRRGLPGHRFPLPLVPGSDGAGTVDAVGPGCSGGFQEGDRVVLSPAVSCGRCLRCTSGEEPLCARFGILGESLDGTNAEYVVALEKNVLPAPPNLTLAETASMPLAFYTAWHMLMTRCRLQPGETVLIHAAASGVSTAAIQIARLCGCTVIATSSQDRKLELARQLGAQHTINMTAAGDWRMRTREITRGEGVDVVVDHVGKDTFAGSLEVLRKGGSVVTCGTTSGPIFEVNVARVFFLGLSILGSTMGSLSELHRVLALARDGRLKPVVDSLLPWEEVARAHQRMGEREVAGKIVLELVPEES